MENAQRVEVLHCLEEILHDRHYKLPGDGPLRPQQGN